MKKNIIILAAAAALLAISCTNLDVDVKSLYTEYPATNVALEAKMADVYYCFRGALGRRFGESSSLSSDEQTASPLTVTTTTAVPMRTPRCTTTPLTTPPSAGTAKSRLVSPRPTRRSWTWAAMTAPRPPMPVRCVPSTCSS